MAATSYREAHLIGFGDAIRAGYSNYLNFSGRATRAEFWWFALWNCLLFVAVMAPLTAATILYHNGTIAAALALGVVGLICLLVFLATLIPSISIQVRRLHDAGHSGIWFVAYFILSCIQSIAAHTAHLSGHVGLDVGWLILSLISLGVSITLLVFFVQPSRYGNNPYGR